MTSEGQQTLSSSGSTKWLNPTQFWHYSQGNRGPERPGGPVGAQAPK